MAILNILHYPDPRLRQKAQPVTVIDSSIKKLVDNMLETMYQAPGIGLAATQVNITKQVVVIDISEDKSSPLILINPEITARQGTVESEEGCLSVPEIFEPVTRAAEITVHYLDYNGQEREAQAQNLLAACIQHELDHLTGKLFIDYLSNLKRNRIRKKMEKRRRLSA
ncbi:peptide deformylase [Candidatus Nitrosoglobus terrae]|uniref:Peptide deformylase n=1 Tax=Candidatus Nitrosoglobus terrae TaxID=1630141 RepID=A0A1Q2SPG1_9GAMM|nr:peptide deformylase [Candidatus Nitrosoglobus terrae]BAW81016.1 peptide deformylase [Candidatus Nitrosoglobus terrae]